MIGINAQLFGSGLNAEEDQWGWLAEQLASQPDGRPVVFVTHKPLFASQRELATAPAVRFVPSPARERIAGLLDPDGSVRVDLVEPEGVVQLTLVDDLPDPYHA